MEGITRLLGAPSITLDTVLEETSGVLLCSMPNCNLLKLLVRVNSFFLSPSSSFSLLSAASRNLSCFAVLSTSSGKVLILVKGRVSNSCLIQLITCLHSSHACLHPRLSTLPCNPSTSSTLRFSKSLGLELVLAFQEGTISMARFTMVMAEPPSPAMSLAAALYNANFTRITCRGRVLQEKHEQELGCNKNSGLVTTGLTSEGEALTACNAD